MGLTWSDAPLAAVYSRPYVVALMPNHIEIRSAQHISQQGLAQVCFVSSQHAVDGFLQIEAGVRMNYHTMPLSHGKSPAHHHECWHLYISCSISGSMHGHPGQDEEPLLPAALPRSATSAAMVHVQVIPVKGMGLMSRSAASSGDVFVASSSGDAGVVRLAPLPFAQQAKALADRNELSAALEMAALVPSTQVLTPLAPSLQQDDVTHAAD